jgi:hypothetical protein
MAKKESKEKGGMRSARMPSKEFERSEGKLGHTSDMKYSSEFGNPQDLDKNNRGLADYIKKNKMPY